MEGVPFSQDQYVQSKSRPLILGENARWPRATHAANREKCGRLVTVAVTPGCGGTDFAPIHPDLATVIDAWPRVPEAVKAKIVAMVQAAGRE